MKNADLSGFEVEYTRKEQSQPDFKIESKISRIQLKPDIDYDIKDMTPEQLEVFDALNYEGDEADYEELEDDFVLMANNGIVPLQSKDKKTDMADDLTEAIKKEKIRNKKFKGDLIDSEKDENTQKKLLDNLEVWNEDEMDRCGYFITAKDLHAGLKVNDKEEFPDL